MRDRNGRSGPADSDGTSPIAATNCTCEPNYGFTCKACEFEKLQRKAWQPIETAPKDGSRILVASPGYIWPQARVQCAWWDKAYRRWAELSPSAQQPTFWMPLPAPPMDEATSGEQPMPEQPKQSQSLAASGAVSVGAENDKR